MSKFLHIKNLEKYHPGYKDRTLIWCKTYFSMINSDPDFEMLCEIDKWRFVAFTMLELQLKKEVPLDDNYLIRKGFDLKKRSISLTLQMLHSFVEVRNESVTQNRVYKENRIEENRVDSENKFSEESYQIDDSYEIIVSRYLYEKIHKFNSTVKAPNFQKWAVHINRMIRLDKITDQQIKYIIDWIFDGNTKQSNFWKPNIQSTSKLREQFSMLVGQAKTENNKPQGASQNGCKEWLRKQGLVPD